MVNISKNEMHPEVRTHIHDQFTDLFIASESVQDLKKLIFEILSPTERTMLAKRVAIIGMLHQGCSGYEISHVLKVSATTIAHIDAAREQGKYATIEAILRRRTARGKFLHNFERFLTFGFSGEPQRRLRSRTRRSIETWRAGGE